MDISSVPSSSSISTKQKIPFSSNKLVGKLCKSFVFSGLFLYITCILLSSHYYSCPQSNNMMSINSKQLIKGSTNITHLAFGIAGSSNTWGNKKHYIESWWKPNKTRGYLSLDRPPIEHLPWPPTSPPFLISGDTSRFNAYNKHNMPFAIRMVRVIEETFKAAKNDQNNGEIRWFVMADDDTVIIIDNLLEVLSRYDHMKYFYIGMNSECVISNYDNSFEMAFGGAGYALSYPLAKALAKNMDTCIKRYPTLFGSDHILQSCIADLGVSLTQEKGFHQVDLHGDISGFLSSHPQSPFLSLHHLDAIDPIFPSMNRQQSLSHLMKAATIDASRLLQQTICYHHIKNWTFSISWGYSIQIYENIIPPSVLHRHVETFIEWKKGARPGFMFNSRRPFGNPCESPHVLFFDSGDGNGDGDGDADVVTSYVRRYERGLPACVLSGNHSADGVSRIQVLSPMTKLYVGAGNRRECCDIVQLVGTNSMAIKLRSCKNDEIIS